MVEKKPRKKIKQNPMKSPVIIIINTLKSKSLHIFNRICSFKIQPESVSQIIKITSS